MSELVTITPACPMATRDREDPIGVHVVDAEGRCRCGQVFPMAFTPDPRTTYTIEAHELERRLWRMVKASEINWSFR